jgi:hypothetical protein
MTFTEAAIEVLRREGKPLHFKKIAEIAVRESLLDHVGKIPDEVMGGQLATHCRLPHADRKVFAVQQATFALVEWGLDEDPAGLDNMIEPPPEFEVPYRPRERHPIPSREVVRTSGRGEARARRREEGEERRGRRYPPPAEVAYEILAGAERPLALADIAAQGAERSLMPDAFVRDTGALASALAEDNRRRETAGRRPLFALEGDTVALAAQPEPGERPVVPIAASRAISPVDTRRSALGALRRRLRECDAPTVEHVIAELLERMNMRELKVAKRGRDHVVYTARRRLGLTEVRHCVRILRGGGEVGRREVADVRRDVGNYGAQIGMIVSAGEAARDARGEATAPGQMPVVLLCGDALVESMTELSVGCRPVVIPEIDEAFFKGATEAALAEEAGRRSRRDERERRDRDTRPEREMRAEEAAEEAAPGEGAEEISVELAPSAPRAPAFPPGATTDEREVSVEVEEGDDEGDEEAEGDAPAAQGAAGPEGERPGGEVRRRRRRRRRRGGRGRGRETTEGPTGEAASATGAAGVTPGAAPPEQAPVAAEPLPGPPPPSAAEPASGDAPERADGGRD